MPVFNAAEFDPNAQVPAAPSEDLVRQFASARGLDPDLMSKVAHTESRGNNNAVSPKGAQGIMQLMPGTAKEMGVDPRDPRQNVFGGVQYFGKLVDMFGGDEKKAAAAYNAGPGRMQHVLSGDQPLPEETRKYLSNIFGSNLPTWAQINPAAAVAGPKSTGKVFDANEFTQTPLHDIADAAPGWFDHLADAAAGNADVFGGMLGGAIGLAGFNPASAVALSGLGAQAGRRFTQAYQQKFHPEELPETKTEQMQQMADSFKWGVLGEVQGQALRVALPWLQTKLYSKLTGADMSKTAEAEAIQMLTRDKIPLGAGQDKAIEAWKAPDNKTIDDIISKYKVTQQPGLVRTGVAGQRSAQQGASILSGGLDKAKLKSDFLNYYHSDTNIPQSELDAAEKAFDNYFGRKSDRISLADARNIKSRVDLKVPFNQQTEGLLQARKTLRYFTSQAMAEAITDPADRAAYVEAAGNLEKKINAEELIESLKGKGKGYAMNRYVAGGLTAGAFGAGSLYGHSPYAGLAAAGATQALTGPTVPSRLVNLLQSPWVRAASTIPTRDPEQLPRNMEATGEAFQQGAGQLSDLWDRLQQK